ncbi:MAG: ribosomal protein small subunit ribosomal protein [Parcubacteria group bacterium]|nr:ribosomal protein small subunit ribosomal protein [Parcubacteria group bacterium]
MAYLAESPLLAYYADTMAITRNAKKAHRASLKKHVYNVRRKRVLTDTVKTVKKLIATDTKEAANSLSAAYKAIDKAAKRGVIKKNTASRKKSRLALAIKRAEGK